MVRSVSECVSCAHVYWVGIARIEPAHVYINSVPVGNHSLGRLYLPGGHRDYHVHHHQQDAFEPMRFAVSDEVVYL